jgi:hypothetical protein
LAQSYQRRWSRFLSNLKISPLGLYLPLVLAALSKRGEQGQRLYLVLDTSVLWNRYCLISLSVVCGGRALPLLWKVIEHASASVRWQQYRGLLRLAARVLAEQEVVFLCDRAFPCQCLLQWLHQQRWQFVLRLKANTVVQGARRCATAVGQLNCPQGEALFYQQVQLWTQPSTPLNLVIAHPLAEQHPWYLITNQPPTLQTVWDYAQRFSIEQLFLDSKSGVFQLEGSRLRQPQRLERLYLVVAIAVLFATLQGMSVQMAGLRRQVDPHWQRGLSYLRIGLSWIGGVFHKGRALLPLPPRLLLEGEPCFPSQKARQRADDRIWFERIRDFPCPFPLTT